MSFNENEESYSFKRTEILYFKEWIDEMMAGIASQQDLLHAYKELYLQDDTPPATRIEYNEMIDKLAGAVAYNLKMITKAEIEGDYMVFYREDGLLGMTRVNPYVKKRIYDTEKMRRDMIV